MAYEKKFKERVLEYLTEGHTERETATVFKVGRSSIQNWKKAIAKTGSLEVKKRNRRAKKLPLEDLEAYVSMHPDAYLSEIGEHFNCSGEAVRKALKKLKITRKKRR